MNQLELFKAPTRPANAERGPYRPFDTGAATHIILERLQGAQGEWVRRLLLSRATGMRPAFVSSLLSQLCEAGTIERTYTMPLVHPLHGNMGQTTGYRIRQTTKEAA